MSYCERADPDQTLDSLSGERQLPESSDYPSGKYQTQREKAKANAKPPYSQHH